MKTTINALALVVGLCSAPALMAATDYSWTTTSGGTQVGSSNGNTRTYTAIGTGVTLTASAFSSTGSGGAVQTAYLGSYGGGLGVTNRGEDGSEPNHTMDNAGNQDAILFNFSSAVELNTVKVGWLSGDSDLWVYRWIGGGAPTLTGSTWTTLLSGGSWQQIGGPYTNVGDGTSATGSRAAAAVASASGQTSSYWLIGTFGNVDGNADYVKISMLGGCVAGSSGCGGGSSTGSVPEPGSLALVTLALGGVLGLRRRKPV